MNIWLAFWNWIQGKKTAIGMILTSTNGFLFAKGLYDETTMMYIAGILVALGLGANIANARARYLASKKPND